MPLFRYDVTYAGETRATELRKSNPQGWLLDAVRATFPEVAARRGGEVLRLRLATAEGVGRAWSAGLDGDLLVRVVQLRG
ncbi:MAG: hypothetical protein QM608_14610 [Caulobacter sp.]